MCIYMSYACFKSSSFSISIQFENIVPLKNSVIYLLVRSDLFIFWAKWVFNIVLLWKLSLRLKWLKTICNLPSKRFYERDKTYVDFGRSVLVLILNNYFKESLYTDLRTCQYSYIQSVECAVYLLLGVLGYERASWILKRGHKLNSHWSNMRTNTNLLALCIWTTNEKPAAAWYT